ncbi:MAG: preprotein translocase subunit SecA [Candidatus Pacebacteria bacterium]|nr:preprotein translocase subunit SecA [Candidatus Paceibacterota bacterium]
MFSLKQLFRENTNKRTLRELEAVVRGVSAQEERITSLDDALLRAQTQSFIDRLQGGETLDSILPEAFAVVREAARRVLGERHYDVQIMGGVVLHRHAIAEMRTGEGKTLVATLPAYLNALVRKGVHVVTVNDYLSRRDAVWMGQVYAFLGLSVGVVNTQASYLYDPTHKEDSSEDAKRDETGSFKVAYEFLRPCTRREAYEADITYGTNSEFGFDYLRDNIEYEAHNLRQRGHHYAIIDEVDSILIDEARTPLIISAPADESGSLYGTFAEIARTFVEGDDYTKDEKLRAIQLTDSGIEKAQRALGVDNIYTDAGIKYVHHLESSVRAKALFERDRHYVVRDDQIVIVDEFTGRLQPGRRWSEGLHQAVEAKEGVTVQRESRTYASVTYQNFFRMYEKIAGMTGTAETSAEEFYSVYKLDVVQIPTNKKVARIDRNDLIFRNEAGKLSAVVRKVREVHEKGQPILIGTASIDKNEQLSESLTRAGVPHEMLNAKNHEREGEIIAQAGRKGAVTIATNMAGRGVDIKLGGSPAHLEATDEVRALGGLFVLGTERHEARRIDNQLRGRAGRQGDPGETLFCVSLDDHLMRVFGNHETIKNLMQRATEADDVPIEFGLISRQIESAQKRIEGFHFDSRKRVLAYDDVLNHQRMAVYARRRTYLQGDRQAMDDFLGQLSVSHVACEETARAKRAEMGDDEFYLALRRLLMQTIDLFWLEHLETMEYLRSSVNLRAYGQRDPLVEYRKEGLRMFRSYETSIADRVAEFLPQMGAGAFASEEERMKRESERAQQVSASVTTGVSGPVMRVRAPMRSYGRNDQVRIEKDGMVREMKFKKAEQFLTQGWKVVE